MIHGRITFIIGLIFIILGLLDWPSNCNRGMTPPGVYENRQIISNDNPESHKYDSWVNQLERKRARGK